MLTVHSDALGEAGVVLQRLSSSLQDTQPLMRSLATLLENSTRKRFETKIAPDGTPWADWKDSTKRRYAKPIWRTKNKKRYLAGLKPRPKERLMRDSSRLLRSLTRHATAQMAQVGTNVEYAPYHQRGVKKKNLPARTMFGISDQDRVDILDLLGEFVRHQWESAT